MQEGYIQWDPDRDQAWRTEGGTRSDVIQIQGRRPLPSPSVTENKVHHLTRPQPAPSFVN